MQAGYQFLLLIVEENIASAIQVFFVAAVLAFTVTSIEGLALGLSNLIFISLL